MSIRAYILLSRLRVRFTGDRAPSHVVFCGRKNGLEGRQCSSFLGDSSRGALSQPGRRGMGHHRWPVDTSLSQWS